MVMGIILYLYSHEKSKIQKIFKANKDITKVVELHMVGEL